MLNNRNSYISKDSGNRALLEIENSKLVQEIKDQEIEFKHSLLQERKEINVCIILNLKALLYENSDLKKKIKELENEKAETNNSNLNTYNEEMVRD